MQAEILPFFAKYIETELGIVYAEHNYFQLQNRLEDIAKALNIPDVLSLYQMAQKGIGGHFKQLLLDSATNNETSFFRDTKVFRALESSVLPQLAERRKPLMIWSAASSTGQEALSVAMTIKEWSEKNHTPLQFQILGTDISERALSRAKSASYTQLEVQRGLPAPLMIKYFKKDDQERWTATAALTQHTSFRSLNLKENFNFAQNFDLILCRNVLIYQNVPGKIEILRKITSNLSPNGFLVMGAGESLFGLSEDYHQKLADGAVLYQRKTALGLAA